MEYVNPLEPQKKRPTMLTVLPILTFIGSGLSFIVFFFLSFSTDYMAIIVEALENRGQPDNLIEVYRQMIGIPGSNFLLLSLCYAIAIIGAALMMRLNKIGFHLYIVSQILLFCFSNFLLGGPFKMGTMGILWSVLFIVLYGLNYKFMNKKNPEEGFGNEEKWRTDQDNQ